MKKTPSPGPLAKPDSPSSVPLHHPAATSSATTRPTLTRPTLTRPSPSPSPLSGHVASSPSSDASDASADAPRTAPIPSSPEKAEIERLREAVRNKMAPTQHLRQMPPTGPTSPGTTTAKKMSPIGEESKSDDMSPLTAAFKSPVGTGGTDSTGSTASAKTIRGSVPATPGSGSMPLRTPSYPFPHVPGTPRTWSPAFHQPFTTLSPTVSTEPPQRSNTPSHQGWSDVTSPSGSTMPFMPGQRGSHAGDHAQSAAPNLYELSLRFNSEPGLDAWWRNVTGAMLESYGADRVTLSVPADATDIENVPWGQKATFNLAGGSEGAHAELNAAANVGPWSESVGVSPMGPTNDENQADGDRPKLETRHSYSGGERENSGIASRRGLSKTTRSRPAGPMRSQTQTTPPVAAAAPTSAGPGQQHFQQPPLEGSVLDSDFSSVSSGPYVAVFPFLRALNLEPDSLVDPSGVLRIVERGNMVTLTRDYTTPAKGSGNSSNVHASSATSTQSPEKTRRDQTASATDSAKPAEPPHVKHSHRELFSRLGAPATSKPAPYEEYEQYSASPWAQSPAPSPAIQNHPEVNPFFQNTNVDESSFTPTETGQDYSKYSQIEAIGVDRASTIIHMPLMHPILSRPMPPIRIEKERSRSRSAKDDTSSIHEERKAPIAILSILSSTVPYPQELAHSMKYLAPHLATSYSNAQQYTNIHNNVSAIRDRRGGSHQMGLAPESTEVMALENLKHQLDVDELAASVSGSMTSPSDYSGRSKQSPSGSLMGTPAWDPSSRNYSTSRSSANTPAHPPGADMVESYFDTKKRTSLNRSQSSAAVPHSQASKAGARSAAESHTEPKAVPSGPSGFTALDDDAPIPKSDAKRRTSLRSRPDPISPFPPHGRDHDASAHAESPSSRKSAMRGKQQPSSEQSERRGHTRLHSYGADFSAPFQNLPAVISPGPPTPNSASRHRRTSSISEDPDMLQPSERLMRTIIGALPVQIFTARPGSGDLTWVNEKFLVYRGHDSRQVLDRPWKAIHPKDKEKYLHVWNRSLRTGQQLQEKLRLKRFDGSYRWFYLRAAPLYDKRQNIVHWLGTMMDVHEQHIAELNAARQQETAASEAKYRALANSSPQIVFAAARAKGVVFCNTQWLNYSGQTEAQALGLGFMDHVHPDDIVKCRLPTFDNTGSTPMNVPTSVSSSLSRSKSNQSSGSGSSGSSETEKQHPSGTTSPVVPLPPAQHKLSQLASTGFLSAAKDADGRPFYSTEVRLRNRDGEYRWHLVRILQTQEILQQEASEETWYGTCTDINAHKTLERDMKESMDAKTRFLSNMSHEIRTPLNGITGMVNFLIDSNLTNEQMEHVNIIRASTEGLRDLINDILDLSKVEAGAIKLVPEWFHPRGLIEDVNDLTSALAIDKGLELNYLVEEDVPSIVKGDRFRIRQVLLNVIGNAIKFTDKGEVFVRCRIYHDEDASLEPDEICLLIDVMDTGSGFTQKEAQVLFKRFSQIDGSSTRQHGGTGLGLVISKQLVELHGGEMTARGEPGKGSTFTFFVKFSLPSQQDQPPPFEGFTVLPTPAGETPSPAHAPKRPTTIMSPSGMVESPGSVRMPPSGPPSAEVGRQSPAASSSSSDPSIRTSRTTSLRSEHSSASSYSTPPTVPTSCPVKLELPQDTRHADSSQSVSQSSTTSEETTKPSDSPDRSKPIPPSPPMYSILVVCPLTYARQATARHIEMTLPKSIPHTITARESLQDYQQLVAGPDPIIFTHIVLILKRVDDVVTFIDRVLSPTADSRTQAANSLIVISDLSQKREVMAHASPERDLATFAKDHRLKWIFRPLKASKIATIFDPGKEREMSADHAHDSAQAIAFSQKAVYEDLIHWIGGEGKRVLLVEDNHVNQMVLTKFLKRITVDVETVLDGVQCTEKVFAKGHDYYSIILCDLHMPNKDGYQTCKEIRAWEKENQYRQMPVIALSANVLGDVYAKCVQAGFNSYVTKPVDFKDLHRVLTTFLDPADPSRPYELMKPRKEVHMRRGSRPH